MKSLELDAFIASSIPKEVFIFDNTGQKIQQLWLEATAPLTAVVERSDSKDISPAEVIQGVRTALVLLSIPCTPKEKDDPATSKPPVEITGSRSRLY